MITIAKTLASNYFDERKILDFHYIFSKDSDTEEICITVTYIEENGYEKSRENQTFHLRDENLTKFLEVIEQIKKVKSLFKEEES